MLLHFGQIARSMRGTGAGLFGASAGVPCTGGFVCLLRFWFLFRAMLLPFVGRYARSLKPRPVCVCPDAVHRVRVKPVVVPSLPFPLLDFTTA